MTAERAPSTRVASTRVASTLRALAALPATPERDAFTGFVTDRGSAALDRTGGPHHLTGSAFVFSPTLGSVLLTFHRKGRFWVQFGGHVEPGDATVAETARREAREESGITDLELLSEAIADLDHHALHGGFACASHWDVGFVAVAPEDTAVTVSDESEDVRWFRLDALPAEVPPGLHARIDGARRTAARLLRLPERGRR